MAFSLHPPTGPRVRKGPRTRQTDRTQTHRTVDGVELVRCGTGWRVDAAWFGFEYDEHSRAWRVQVPGQHDELAKTLARGIRNLRNRGLLPKAAS